VIGITGSLAGQRLPRRHLADQVHDVPLALGIGEHLLVKP
jgi:hypothetical protein